MRKVEITEEQRQQLDMAFYPLARKIFLEGLGEALENLAASVCIEFFELGWRFACENHNLAAGIIVSDGSCVDK